MKLSTLHIAFILILVGTDMFSQGTPSCVGSPGQLEWKYWRNLPGSNIENLYDHVYYPQAPKGKISINNINVPKNFDEYYGSLLAGFIKVPETGTFQFNLTADNKSQFFLSTNEDPEDLVLRCNCPGPTKGNDHTKYSAQTSTFLNLTAGDYLYFELALKERTGVDHAQVFWKTPSQNDDWYEFPSNVLFEYTCDVECDVVGTPCDDGNASTIDDRQDGYCNCFGIPKTNTNSCIGDRGDINVLYYDSIGGTTLNYLLVNDNFPLMPHRTSTFDRFFMPGEYGDEYGAYIRGYINPPVTGNYVFNIVSNDASEFHLSSNDQNSTNNLNLICYVDGATSSGQHYKYPEQTSDSVYLEAGEIYYFEALHKERRNQDHFALYWRTPYTTKDAWVIVDGIYLNSFECELACLPEGTACDDGDPQTMDDMIDANCDCVGTPCGGPCPEDPPFIPIDRCDLKDQHSNRGDDAWLSCTKTMNPKSSYGNSHWIMYDFGKSYQVNRAQYWNYNTQGSTLLGAKDIAVDYSEDGVTWSHLNTYFWKKAPGTLSYKGDTLIGIYGINARYILMTILNTRSSGSNCAGFSEIIFEVEECGFVGVSCDDNNPQTVFDTYDENCNCIGVDLAVVNECDTNILQLQNQMYPSGTYDATQQVRSKALVTESTLVTYTAQQAIVLQPGFETELGSGFIAIPADCAQSAKQASSKDGHFHIDQVHEGPIRINYNEKIDETLIQFEIIQSDLVVLYLVDSQGEIIRISSPIHYEQPGYYRKNATFQNLKSGVYTLVVKTSLEKIESKVVIAR